ncbi:DUF637 domain-containing protein, partial [Pseudomonas sp. URMO17WK12:I2]|uniref:DUF637 domain-containing protein n=1 Tax=Pseudomonas sp. URMO17WK12:I2 TaxID=1261623 RepID=UPI000DB07AB2
KDLDQESHEKSSNSLVWTSAKGKGTTDETLLQTQMIAQGEIAIKAVEGLNIDIKHVDQQTVSQTIDAMVEADPQLAWLKAAEQRGDVDWHRVKEIHDSFKYSHSGLGGGAAIVIAIIVAYFAGPLLSQTIAGAAGAGAGAGTATSATSAWAAASATQAAGWANAAATAIATSATSSAAVSTINNRGNLGAIFKDVTSSDALKGYMVTGVTAGLTTGLYDQWTDTTTTPSTTSNAVGPNTPLSNTGAVSVSGSGLGTWSGVGRFAANQALQNTTSAALSKLVGQDGSFSDALQSTLANTFMAAGFNWIGDNTAPGAKLELENGSLAKAGLHAVMGGLTAEAMGGDFKTGALAAGVNELLVEKLDAQYQKMDVKDRKALLVMNSQLVGVFTAGLQGGDEQRLHVASAVAGGATSYNFLNHKDVEDLGQALDDCKKNGNCEDVRAEFQARDAANSARLAACTTDCAQIRDELDMGSRALYELWQGDNTGITDEFLTNNTNEWSTSGPRVATQVATAALEGKPEALSQIGQYLDQQGFNPFGLSAAGVRGLVGGKASSGTTKGSEPKIIGVSPNQKKPNWDNAVSRADGGLNQPGGAKGAVGNSKNNLPVLFDGEFATKQLLGTAKTPGGKQINFHAADRMVNPPKGRKPMTIREVEDFIDTADKIKKITIDSRGTSVTLMNSKYPKAQVAVDGNRIITVVNPVRKNDDK